MKGLSFAFVLLASAAAAQESTPFAQQPYRASGETSLLSLSDVMAISQMRHIKLWQSAKAENWPLATYATEKLRDSLFRAATLYANIPVSLVKGSDQQLTAVADAAAKRDMRAFDKAFADLTASCNSCHQAAGLDFIRMRTPSSSPFSDQDFMPAKKAR
jgi:hypothetical protein